MGQFGMQEIVGCDMGDERILRLPELDVFLQFSIGPDHGLAIDSAGSVFSFGDAAQGALGNGTSREQEFHRPKTVGGLERACQVSAGLNSSFAIAGN